MNNNLQIDHFSHMRWRHLDKEIRIDRTLMIVWDQGIACTMMIVSESDGFHCTKMSSWDVGMANVSSN